ncbi:hypothetical protein LOD99_13760 [Oopsacas minuta]|uniref:Hyccin n=1 Tax=Oopsacas minuta TaxID=111878 RepID=A0AAV7KII2_9METZ|nr:hypothetical protein LOD99_13760 [Oopsacas minuta]
MNEEILPLLRTLIQLTEDGSVTEDHLLQLCDEHTNFHTHICQCLEPYQSETSELVYKWLYLWFSSLITSLRCYSIQFIPPLLSTYLSAIYSTAATCSTLKKRCEVCLSALLVHLKEPPNSIISIQNATNYISLYYYPNTPLDKQTTPRGDSLSEGVTPIAHTESFKYIDKINASTRPLLLSMFLAIFTEELSSIATPVKLSFCRAVTVICSSGISEVPSSPYLTYSLDKQEHNMVANSQLNSLQKKQRIQLSESLLVEMCQGLKFCLNKSELLATLQAAEIVYFRSLLECWSQAMLCSNALLNLLTEELQEEIREFELSSPNNSLSTPVEDTGEATLAFDFDKNELNVSTAV